MTARVEQFPELSCSNALAGSLAQVARNDAREWTPAHGVAAVDALRAAGPAHRRLAVALVAGVGPRWGWGEAWTMRLASLRRDDDLGVRTEALEVPAQGASGFEKVLR